MSFSHFLLSKDTGSFLLGLNGKLTKRFIVFKWICIIRNGEATTIFWVIVIYNVQGISDTIIMRQSSCPGETCSLGQESKKYGPWAQSSPPSAFINEVFLELSHTHSLRMVCGSFHTTTAGLSSYNRDWMAPKASRVYYLAFHGRLPDSWEMVLSVFSPSFCHLN